MKNNHISQEMQVLMFITQHGPVRIHDLNKFGVENYINYPLRLKNMLMNKGLVDRLPINDPEARDMYQYIASNLFKQWRKEIV